PDSPLYDQYAGRDVASRYAVTPAIGEHFPTVRDLDASRLPLQYSEALALPPVVVCHPTRTNRRRRRRHFALVRYPNPERPNPRLLVPLSLLRVISHHESQPPHDRPALWSGGEVPGGSTRPWC